MDIQVQPLYIYTNTNKEMLEVFMVIYSGNVIGRCDVMWVLTVTMFHACKYKYVDAIKYLLVLM